MKNLVITLVASLFALSAMTASAAPAPTKKKHQTTLGLYLSPTEAYNLKKDGGEKVLFVDIRTQAEQEFVGQPTNIDKNIPSEFRDFTKYDAKKKRHGKVPNKQFVTDIEELVKSNGLSKDSDIILICRSGSRSAKMTNVLAKNGYTKVYTVLDGFQGGKNKADHKKRNKAGWKHDNLPWTWKLVPEKMYLK